MKMRGLKALAKLQERDGASVVSRDETITRKDHLITGFSIQGNHPFGYGISSTTVVIKSLIKEWS